MNFQTLNSSWHWLTTSVMPVFPFAVVITLLIECLVIIKANHLKKYSKPIIVIVIANFLSFCLPYLFVVFNLYRSFRMNYNGRSPFAAAFESTPFYIVGIAYLLLTVIIEVPIVCLSLKKDTQNIKALIISTISVNIFTTILVAITERLICRGSW